MPRFRFSLRALAAVVALIACLAGALADASDWIAGLAVLIAVCVLAWSILAAIERRGLAQSFWRYPIQTIDTAYVANFTSIAQAAFTLLAGCLGGFAAQRMRERAESERG